MKIVFSKKYIVFQIAMILLLLGCVVNFIITGIERHYTFEANFNQTVFDSSAPEVTPYTIQTGLNEASYVEIEAEFKINDFKPQMNLFQTDAGDCGARCEFDSENMSPTVFFGSFGWQNSDGRSYSVPIQAGKWYQLKILNRSFTRSVSLLDDNGTLLYQMECDPGLLPFVKMSDFRIGYGFSPDHVFSGTVKNLHISASIFKLSQLGWIIILVVSLISLFVFLISHLLLYASWIQIIFRRDSYSLLFVLSILFMFWLPFIQIFALTDMWFLCMADKINSGEVLYRDIFCPLPPVYPLLWCGLAKLFGHSLFLFREYGILEKICFVSLTFFLFRTVTCRKISVILTLLSAFLFSNSYQDIFYSYYQFALIVVFVAVLLQIKGIEKGKLYWFLLAGGCVGFSIFVKQTIGVFVAATSLGVIPFLYYRFGRKWISMASAWLAGFLSVIGIGICLCHCLFGLNPFLKDVFGIGQKSLSKGGSIWQILFGFIQRIPGKYYIAFTLIMLGLFLCRFLAAGLVQNRTYKGFAKESFLLSLQKSATGMMVFSIITIFAIIAAFLTSDAGMFPHLTAKNTTLISEMLVHYCFFGIVLLGLLLTYMIFKKSSFFLQKMLLLTAISFGIMYSHGLSFILEDHCLVPAFGCVVLLTARYVIKIPPRKLLMLLIIISVPLVFLMAYKHYAVPYSWWGWKSQPAGYLTQTVSIPALKGYRFSAGDEKMYEKLYAITEKYSKPGEPIYTYPHIPVFHILAERPLPWAAVTHYFDFCPDWVIDDYDLPMLKRIMPPVIIYMGFPQDAWTLHEQYFRGGNESAQRRIYRWLQQKVRSGEYRPVQKEQSSNECFPIIVYIRADRLTNSVKPM